MRIHALIFAVVVAACSHHSSGTGTDANGGDGGFSTGDGGTDGTGPRPFAANSLIIPMDLSYQASGMFQAYGLVYQLLAHHITVYWLIDPNKTYHSDACNNAADPCSWDCDVDGTGTKCAYPTSSPDVDVSVNAIWSDTQTAMVNAPLGAHAYRGGPFAIDAADHDAALAIVNAWNDKTMWAANPWAQRTVFNVVSVHQATAGFTGPVARVLTSAPTIAVFADGNEDIATGYIRAAGIPQSNGAEFPAQKCGMGMMMMGSAMMGSGDCGPGTSNPDMLTETAIMGDLGTCAAPNLDHKNGALWDANGNPAYCQIMSMHWDVMNRETVQCNGGMCPSTQAACGTEPITFNGHEVVAEVRAFLQYPVHFFAECQAVDAFENTVPNPNWPFLDDTGRDGHFLTTTGTPPLCPAGTCSDASYSCVQGSAAPVACNGQACCMPTQETWVDIPGYEVASQPTTGTVKVLRPDIPYNQFDGEFGTTGGSEPAYNLSSYLGTTYKNNRQVTLLTGPNGPGDEDLWMTGYLDGCDQIIFDDHPGSHPGTPSACQGKISYLGGHQYTTTTPVASDSQSQGARLFLNALFEAQCGSPQGDALH